MYLIDIYSIMTCRRVSETSVETSVSNSPPNRSIINQEYTHHVRRTVCFFTNYDPPALENLSPMRGPLPRRPQSSNIPMFPTIPIHGACSDVSPKQFTRAGRVPALSFGQAISSRSVGRHITKHACKSQRKSRLADLCRLRPASDRNGSSTLRSRRQRVEFARNRLRTRLVYHRFVSFAVSVGTVSKNQIRHQITHLVGFTGKYSLVY